MRDKEVKQDYRFMPEPNLPPLRLCDSDIENCVESMPELPSTTRTNLVKTYKVTLDTAVRLVNEPAYFDLFSEAVRGQEAVRDKQTLANLILLNIDHLLAKNKIEIQNLNITGGQVARAANMKSSDELTHTLILRALEALILGQCDNLDIYVESQGWKKVFRDGELIKRLVSEVITENEKVAKKFVKTGKTKLLQELVQSVLSKNDVLDPILVKAELEKRLQK